MAWFADIKEWEGLRSVEAVELEKTENGQTTIERRYFISSLGLGAAKFACAVRDHWGVENNSTGYWMSLLARIKAARELAKRPKISRLSAVWP